MAEKEMTAEELRSSVEAEVFGDPAGVETPPNEPEKKAETTTAEPVVKTEAAPDPWEKVDPVIKKEVEALREKVGSYENVSTRLKQAESRLGSVINELHAAKQAAKTVAAAPSKAQIEDAAASQAEWEELKKDFPDWAKAMDSRLAAQRTEFLSKLPNIEVLREEIAKQAREEISSAEAKFSDRLIRFKHPKWVEKINSDEFKTWYEEKGKPDSEDPLIAIQILDDFDAHQKAKKPTQDIVAERKGRLEQSQTREPGRKLPPKKSEEDMSAEELRASIAKEVWSA